MVQRLGLAIAGTGTSEGDQSQISDAKLNRID
jgi:hypothetical protein